MSSCLSHASCISYFKPDADGSNSTGFSPDNGDVWDPPTDPNGASILEMKPRAQLVAQLRGSSDLSPQMSDYNEQALYVFLYFLVPYHIHIVVIQHLLS